MPDTALVLKFGNGDYRFWLPMRELCQLEKECDKSVIQMHDEMGQSLGLLPGSEEPHFIGGGQTRFHEIRATIRFALLGGNEGKVNGEDVKVSPITAREIVETYVDGRPIAETLPVAWSILEAAVRGVSLKKKVEDEAGGESLSPSEKA
jgi:hypothetical protein